MLELKDFDTIRMYPGDTLVMRPREEISSDQMRSFMAALRKGAINMPFKILLVPYDFELFRLKGDVNNA